MKKENKTQPIVDLEEYIKSKASESYPTSVALTKENRQWLREKRINLSKLINDFLERLRSSDVGDLL